jgi:carboxymethylenebutenolidase
MGFHADWVYYGEDNRYSGYLVKPDRLSGTVPAVLVFQEIWGVDEHIQDVTRRFAQAGYVAFAPDLYARNGKRDEVRSAERIEEVKRFLDTMPPGSWHDEEQRNAAMNQLPEDQRKRVSETFTTLFGGLKMDLYKDQLLATTAFLRGQNESTKGQGIASTGYCMGGALSAFLACHDQALKGAVIYYGRAPQADLIPQIQCPVIGFYGGLDPNITNAVPDFAELMKKNGKSFDYQVYKGAQHAFFNDTRASYNVEASRDAFARTLAFFKQVLS